MKLEFIGADHEVTGSCHFIEVGNVKALVDCGMEQGADIYENQEIPVNAADIDYVFVTHAHIDHSGLLPLLYARGFRGGIFATEATTELCNIMLKDSAHIQEFEAEWKNRKAKRSGKSEVTPIYVMNDAIGVLELFEPCPYHEKFKICDEISIRFIDAGHLLGSASIEIWLTEDGITKKIVFSGDIGNKTKPLIKNPEYITEADYVVMESTYGDREHTLPKDNDFAKALAEIIEDTMERGGNVVIPAFSVGRTQEILYFIRRIKEESLMKNHLNFPVYMDSPLAVEATHIFNENVRECFDEEALKLVSEGRNPIGFPGLKVAVSSDQSRMINTDMTPKVIISASGMCEAGRIRHHLKHNLWRKESTILFVGYQVPGTLGFNLLHDANEVRLFGETVNVNAQIKNLPGISGHADRSGLIYWAKQFQTTPKRFFIVHGDNKVVEPFAQTIAEECKTSTYAPFSGDVFDLITNEKLADGNHEVKEKKKASQHTGSSVYDRLVAACQRLSHLIEKCSGMANKDLAKFADQINSICDKWE